ncbi:MAG: DNA polymerase IV [Robiginitomaculum sp.]|nr:MAG: DNA polymerase IV [Robiginitomaculum sp.]
MSATSWCRDCARPVPDGVAACPKCRSARLFHHPEASSHFIAHLDCDAFFASVEKRDNPELKAKPLLIGGKGPRAVVATACYLARAYGARSAMPMGKAKRLCPRAVIVSPNIKKYAYEGQKIREMMRELTPMVEPLSIDEAFMDLSGTERLHHAPPIQILMELQNKIEIERGLGVSIGLSHNKFLAKIASDLDKPRGFSVIGKAETMEFLAPKAPTFVYGVGPAFGQRLKRDGLLTLAQIRELPEMEMARRYGESGQRLHRLASGNDQRKVNPVSIRKSISSETTFNKDINDLAQLEKVLWRMCEKTSTLAKNKQLAGHTLTLKLKTSSHQILTRSITKQQPVQLTDTLFRELGSKLARAVDGQRFRLLGAGLSTLVPVEKDFREPVTDLLEPTRERRAKAERAMDAAREKFGPDAIIKGRGLRD